MSIIGQLRYIKVWPVLDPKMYVATYNVVVGFLCNHHIATVSISKVEKVENTLSLKETIEAPNVKCITDLSLTLMVLFIIMFKIFSKYYKNERE